MMSDGPILEAARAATSAGIVALPTRPGKKSPAVDWARYQSTAPSPAELRTWFVDGNPDGLGLLCGRISGNLELLEFEDTTSIVELKSILEELGRGDLWRHIEAGYAESTPGGGVHWLYRTEEPPGGNAKLASRACPVDCAKHETGRPHVLIETRGEGGFVVVAPTSARDDQPSGLPYELRSGGFDLLATLSAADHALLWGVARSLDQLPVPVVAIPRSQEFINLDGSERPGDRLNKAAPWNELLAGWRRLFTRNGLTYWSRPGKKDAGISATTGKRDQGDDMLRVFTTSTELEPRMYSPFAAYAALSHGGDFAEAARALTQDPRYRRPDEAVVADQVVEEPAGSAPSDGFDRTKEHSEHFGAPRPPTDTPPVPYHFETVFPYGHFVARYVQWAASRTDAPHEYHEAMGVMLLAALTPGVRAHLSAWEPDGLATNMYAVLVGVSSKARKSTAIRAMKEILGQVDDGAIFPDRFSPEAMLEQLSKRPMRPAVWFPDEWGQMVESLERDPPARSNILTLYDSPRTFNYARHSKRVQGGERVTDQDTLTDAHWNIVGATTDAVFDVLSSRHIDSGFLPRFAIIYPTTYPERMPLHASNGQTRDAGRELVDYARALSTWVDAVKGLAVVEFDPAALAMLDAYQVETEDRQDSAPIVARLTAMAVKVSMLSVLGRGVPSGDNLVIKVTTEDARIGVTLARRWSQGAEEFADNLGGLSPSERQHERRGRKALSYLRRNGGSAGREQVMRHLHVGAREMTEIERTLHERGEMWVVEVKTSGRPMRLWTVQKGLPHIDTEETAQADGT